MAKIDVISLDGTTRSQVDMPAIFNAEPKKELLHQAVVTYLSNQRQGNAHTKTRGEIRGGGRKPWKQKGTGRARAGSSRSPIWIGGGITFGPSNVRNYTKRLPAKMKKLALSMAFSAKVKSNELRIVDSLAVSSTKTKNAAKIIKHLVPEATSVLLITQAPNQALIQATNNISQVTQTTIADLNVYDILSSSMILIEKGAVEVLNARTVKE